MESEEPSNADPIYLEVSKNYKVGKTIGSGGFGKVKLATHLLTGEKVALKVLNKVALKADLPRIAHEINALKTLDHPNICKLYQVIDTQDHVFLVMEYCCGGELFDHIVEKDKLSEDESRVFFRQIVGAVSYCHKLGFVHRDLKPENILLDEEQNLKIVDFGLTARPKEGENLKTSCGSPNYAAPEIIRGEPYVGAQADVWSLGVLLYTLLCGNLPFDDSALDKLYKKIQKGIYEEPEFLSDDVRALMKQLLQVNPLRRITTENLCKHPWLNFGFTETLDNQKCEANKLLRDEECLNLLSEYKQINCNKMWTTLKLLKNNDDLATYKILFQIKMRNPSMPLNSLVRPLITRTTTFILPNNETRRCLYGKRPRTSVDGKDSVPKKRPAVMEKSPLVESTSSNVGSEVPEFNSTFVKKPSTPFTKRGGSLHRKRIRSPGLDERGMSGCKKINLDTDSSLLVSSDIPETPTQESMKLRTPSSARKMLNGLEKGWRFVLSPYRSMGTDSPRTPVFLNKSQMSNITCTNSTNPESLLTLLQTALLERGITCKQEGFVLRGKVKKPGLFVDQTSRKLAFELEICWVPKTSQRSRRSSGQSGNSFVVGIRRKRLKGDAYMYKTVCEEVLAVASAT